MTMLLTAAHFEGPAPLRAGRIVEGLAGEIDAAAEGAAESHRFLRQAWFAAALSAYGGTARTVVVENKRGIAAAVPLVPMGPRWLSLGMIPGCYWPLRSAPIADHADEDDLDRLLAGLARAMRGVRIGPVPDDDPLVERLVPRARARGWAVIDRVLGESWRFAFPAVGEWPRASTLKKNRWFEKQLAADGALNWHFLSGADWTPALFDTLAGIERASWIGTETDGGDTKFLSSAHGAFWRAAAADPVLADMMQAAVLTVGGAPAAFGFELDSGVRRYVIANNFVPEHAAHSPGRLLAYRSMPRARDAGAREIDWGSGDSGYKRTLGAERGPPIRDWVLVRPGVDARVARLLRRFA